LKKRLTPSEEFEIMKLVLDKFLWIGVLIMVFGLYKLFEGESATKGLSIIILGAIFLVIFLIIIVKEYEIVK